MQRTVGRFDQDALAALITVVGAAIAWTVRWTQDDAYISMRYARNLVEGHGLVYNVGEHVEGYTNFLWTVLLALPIQLGWDPVEFAHLVGVACFVGTTLLTIRTARVLFGSALAGNLAALTLMLSVTFVAYATGGLETQLQTLLATAVISSIVTRRDDRPTWWWLVTISTLSGFAFLTRMDSAVVLAVPLVALAASLVRRRPTDRRSSAIDLCLLLVPALVLVVPWLLWRHAVYDAWVPNTAVAKRTEASSLIRGGSYLVLFAVVTGMIAFAPAAVLHRRHVRPVRPLALLAATIGMWVGYVWLVGADFMEFRFMVVVLPLLAVVGTGLFLQVGSSRWQLAIVAVLLLSATYHVVGFRGTPTIESVGSLSRNVDGRAASWPNLGRQLRADLVPGNGELDDPRLAVTAAGAIPYESRLPTVDMLGLMDRWTARHGERVRTDSIPKAGHERMATVRHLLDSGVHLVLGHPQVIPPETDGSYGRELVDRMFIERTPDPENLPSAATVVEMPLTDGRVLAMLYLQAHPAVDRLVADGTWREVPLG